MTSLCAMEKILNLRIRTKSILNVVSAISLAMIPYLLGVVFEIRATSGIEYINTAVLVVLSLLGGGGWLFSLIKVLSVFGWVKTKDFFWCA